MLIFSRFAAFWSNDQPNRFDLIFPCTIVALGLRFFGTEIGLMWVEVFVFVSRQEARVGIVLVPKKGFTYERGLVFLERSWTIVSLMTGIVWN